MEDKTIHCTQVCCQFSAYVLVRQRMFNVVKVPLSKILFLRMEQHVLIRIHCTALWQNKRRIPYEILVSIFFFFNGTLTLHGNALLLPAYLVVVLWGFWTLLSSVNLCNFSYKLEEFLSEPCFPNRELSRS